MANDKWMTVAEVAGLLKVGQTKLYKMAQQGEVPVSKVGNQWRFERDEIEAWVRSQRDPAGPSGYVHGYSPRESERLIDQATTLEELLHCDTSYMAGSLVLEAGCGVGAQTVALASRSPQASFIAMDISETSLAAAKKRVQEAGLSNVVFIKGDIYDLPFVDGNFDHVFVCFVLEHLAQPERALKGLRRVLKVGGTMTVIEGDHGSAYFHPDSKEAHLAIDCQVRLQKRGGGNSCIGRKLYPMLTEAAYADVRVSPRMVYVDGSRPQLIEGFTRRTFTAMVEGVRQEAIDAGMIDAQTFDKGIADLYRTAEADGVFCYTFFKAVALKE